MLNTEHKLYCLFKLVGTKLQHNEKYFEENVKQKPLMFSNPLEVNLMKLLRKIE